MYGDVVLPIKVDGSLYDPGWYLEWKPGRDTATLDGQFTAQQLRDIAAHMDEINNKLKHVSSG